MLALLDAREQKGASMTPCSTRDWGLGGGVAGPLVVTLIFQRFFIFQMEKLVRFSIRKLKIIWKIKVVKLALEIRNMIGELLG